MAVEDNNGGNSGGGGFSEIGVGMRVLAVDDDPTCLAVLEGLLRKCKYRVTVTNQAIKALSLLREDKTRFDLVISDVSMPDMDGFKLLELVGIEMDLPVIMLSQYSDQEFVYRGVMHGAVDYLVKPVRLDMVQNIWQHVIRKKKSNPGDQNNSADNRGQDVVGGDGGQAVASSGSTDRNMKLNRKRKDQEDEEDEGSDDNENENDEHGKPKKPRVVWTGDLHKKFVDAINQLGFDKAVPKKILDLMNVEGLTRENVASHLQKYRIFLKKFSVVPPQQGNVVGAFGARDAAFLRIGSMDGCGDFRSLSGPGRVSSTSFTSYMPGGMSARLNTPGGLTLRGIANSGLLQGHLQSSSNSSNVGKLQPALLPGNQATRTFHGGPSLLQPNQFHGNPSNLLGEFSVNDDKSGLTIASGFPDARATAGSLANTMSNLPGNHLMLQVNSQQNQNRGSFGNQHSTSVPSSNQQSFEVGISGSSSFMDQGRCNENWQIAFQLSKFPSTTTPINESFNHEQLSAHNPRDNISIARSLISNNPVDFSGLNYLPPSLEGSKADIQGQAGSICSVVPNTKQRWDDLSQANNPSLISCFGNVNSMVSENALAGPLLQGMDQRKKHEGPYIGQINAANNEYLLDQTKPQNSFIQNNYDGLDDLMNKMIKRDPSESILMDSEFAFDTYSL